jgi:hypothetical protein
MRLGNFVEPSRRNSLLRTLAGRKERTKIEVAVVHAIVRMKFPKTQW